jgi:uncharacterized protein
MPMNKLTAIPFTSVSISDRFWSPRVRANRTATLRHQYEQLKTTGRIDALKLEWKPGQEPVPHQFWDSDIAKWIEAGSYSLMTHPDPALEAQLDEVIALYAASQQPDGYLNTHFTSVRPEQRFTNLRDAHELYCAGHLIEAAVAHFQATGKRTLLNVMCRYADLIGRTFGTDAGQKRGYCGHEEIELALVKLARVTGEKRYLDLARYFVDERGREPLYFEREAEARGEEPKLDSAKSLHRRREYWQVHKPVREQDRVVGHAVRAMYLYSAMADLAQEDADQSLLDACHRLWDNLCLQNMYITGGIGSTRHNEGFTSDYDLPNESAYAETCAAIGLVFWAHRLLQVELNGRYGDVMERALYNGVLSGVSLDGTKFFYVNPLASNGQHHRQDWFGCACCPPNVARLLASLGQYVYSTDDRSLVTHLYVAGSATARVGGQETTVQQRTDYPWDGKVTLGFDLASPASFGLKLRIPAWCRDASIAVNGQQHPVSIERGYASIDRTWKSGDTVDLNLPMLPQRIYANPLVQADIGRVALQRGPVIFCLEAADNGPAVEALSLSRDAEITAHLETDLFDGVTTLTSPATRTTAEGWEETLYRPQPPKTEPATLKAIPYFAWDNRQPGEMLVWIREG